MFNFHDSTRIRKTPAFTFVEKGGERELPLDVEARYFTFTSYWWGDKLTHSIMFPGGRGGENVPPFLFRDVYVADDLVRALPTNEERRRMKVTNPRVTFNQAHFLAKRAYRSCHFKMKTITQ
ncbi:hypothetical protein TNCV_567961 [Trichonephila clavipes]|nr:hypothetical protein TNCV_567961 [Trichonephila clavipes]